MVFRTIIAHMQGVLRVKLLLLQFCIVPVPLLLELTLLQELQLALLERDPRATFIRLYFCFYLFLFLIRLCTFFCNRRLCNRSKIRWVFEYCCCFLILFIFNFVFCSRCVLLALCFCWLCFKLFLLLFISGQFFCCFLLFILFHNFSF